ncbi:unnamed protein product [Chrysoparadoxa australica]
MQLFTKWLGPLPALGITSVLFGLAHSPVPGLMALTETAYGFTFGWVHLASGRNLFAAMLAHFVYDAFTFFEVHGRAANEYSAVVASMPQRREKVKALIDTHGITEDFYNRALQMFNILDADGSGGISKRELRLAARTLGDQFLPLGDVEQVFKKADVDKDSFIEFDEYLAFLVEEGIP